MAMQNPVPRHTIAHKLPLLISGLLLTVVAVFTFVAYQQISSALISEATAKMTSSAAVLAGALETSGRTLRREVERTARNSSVRRFLLTNDAASRARADTSLASDIAATPQAIGVDVRDREGNRLLWVDGPAVAQLPSVQNAAPAHSVALQVLAHGTAIGPLGVDHGIIYYNVVAPVTGVSNDTIGFVGEYRQLPAGQGALIRGLVDRNAGVMLGNRTGGVWTDLSAVAPAPHAGTDGQYTGRYTAAHGIEKLGATVPVRSTPWVVWVEVNVNDVLAPGRRFLRNAIIAAAMLLLIGAFAAMIVSRQITGPLRDVTNAAQGIAAGDYTRRVKADRADELGVLAASFNSMAEQIEDARNDMEGRVTQRTKELKDALTELHEIQEALVQREKLAILGQLAGGVGHELRNPLGVMTNAIYILGVKLKDAPDTVKEYLGILRTQVGLSEKIVGDLLDFARVKQPNVATFPLPALVQEELERVGPLDRISVECDFPGDLPAVRADRVQMGQVVLNLISNAVQAMEGDDARLTLRARAGHDGLVALDVIDTGIGMTPEQLSKMFDPLYTTKARGIGLGLAVSRTLAQVNGGDIHATSKPGTGSTVTVSIPSATAMKAA
jgi:signal transduction histidine kinase